MGRVRVAGVRDSRERMVEFLRNGDLVFITRHGGLTGLLLGLDRPAEIPVEIRRELLGRIGEAVSQRLADRGALGKDVERGFREWRSRRRADRGRRGR